MENNVIESRKIRYVSNYDNETKIDENWDGSDPLSFDNIKTRLITLQDRPDLGLIYDKKANKLSNKQQYATIVSNMISNNTGLSYFFNIPIACQGWRQIGFGCFIIIPYHEKHPEVQRAVDIVEKYAIKAGAEYPGSVIILEMKCHTDIDKEIVSIAQTVRLFIAPILSYSMSRQNFKSIQNSVYLITTDVDLIPLSTLLYHDYSTDFQVVNPGNIVKERDQLYMALSCVGATIGLWNYISNKDSTIFRDKGSKKYLINHFNDTGIQKALEIEHKYQIKRHKQQGRDIPGKMNWYMDQLLISHLIRNYVNENGWDNIRVHPVAKSAPDGRVNRNFFYKDGNHFQNLIDMSLQTPFKDAHFCKETLKSLCWWNVYHLLKRIMGQTDLQLLIDYRIEFIKEMLKNEFVGDPVIRHYVKFDDSNRQKYLKMGYENKPKPILDFDVRKKWTAAYPRIYTDAKPQFVDWRNERVFKETLIDNNFSIFGFQEQDFRTPAITREKNLLNLFAIDELPNPERITRNKRVIYKVVPRQGMPAKLEKMLLTGVDAKEMFFQK